MNAITNAPQGITLSSAIGDIHINTDADFAIVRLSNDSYESLLSERYYAHKGKINVCNIRELIEADMRQHSLVYALYYIDVYASEDDLENQNADDYTILEVIYCDRFAFCQDVETFLAQQFLTTLHMRRVPPRHACELWYYVKKGESMSQTANVCYRIEGSDALQTALIELHPDTPATKNMVTYLTANIQTLADKVAKQKLILQKDITILSATLNAGERSATVFVDETLGARPSAQIFLRFLNCFNVWEQVIFCATTTTKTDIDRSVAIIDGQSEFYNQRVTKSYETNTTPLTSDEAAWIDQLLTAHQVEFHLTDPTSDDEDYFPILITDSTCEITDDDEHLNTIKFTWRFADNRPHLPFTLSEGIFADQYNNVFS